MKTCSPPEETSNAIATSLQELIANEFNLQGENAMVAILDIVEEGIQKLFCATNLDAQKDFSHGIRCWGTRHLWSDQEGRAS